MSILYNPDAIWLVLLGVVQGLYLGFWLGWYKCARDDVKRANKESKRLMNTNHAGEGNP